jgi:hypothetical protein
MKEKWVKASVLFMWVSGKREIDGFLLFWKGRGWSWVIEVEVSIGHWREKDRMARGKRW